MMFSSSRSSFESIYRYTLGILVLKEQYEEFFKYYDNQTDIGENQLKEWPLFRELRKSKEYLERFPEGKIEEKKEIECKMQKMLLINYQ